MWVPEYKVVQNAGIGALVLHKFVLSFFDQQDSLHGPNLAMAMPILPLVYHQESLGIIAQKNKKGGFFNALAEKRDLPVGLHERMVEMSEQTFDSLNVSFACGLLTYDKDCNELIPGSSAPMKPVETDIKKMIQGADRLGYWFSTLTFEQICSYLNLRF